MEASGKKALIMRVLFSYKSWTAVKVKFFASLVIFLVGLVLPVQAGASLIAVDKDGKIVVKVLSAQTTDMLLQDNLANTKVAVTQVAGLNLTDPGIGLTKSDVGTTMQVLSEGSLRELDVTNVSDDLVEIEERPNMAKIAIYQDNGSFSLKQGSFVAIADLPIEIDAKKAKMSFDTNRGKEYVGAFPLEAVESALRSGFISRITDDKLPIIDNGNNLVYKIKGERDINILNLTSVKIPLELSVSLANGRVTAVNSEMPLYNILKVFLI